MCDVEPHFRNVIRLNPAVKITRYAYVIAVTAYGARYKIAICCPPRDFGQLAIKREVRKSDFTNESGFVDLKELTAGVRCWRENQNNH